MDKNTTHLAGEFLVAGELSRRGLGVSITFGNAKSVDIVAQSATSTYRVDAKALRSKSNWPVSAAQIDRDVYYVFVYLGTAATIRKNLAPEYFVVLGADLIDQNIIQYWAGGRSGVTYKSLAEMNKVNQWQVFV